MSTQTERPPQDALLAELREFNPAPEQVGRVALGFLGSTGAEVAFIPALPPGAPSGAAGFYNREHDTIVVLPTAAAHGDLLAMTVFTALIHWAGHPSRLAVWGMTRMEQDSEEYHRGTLRGAIGCSMLLTVFGVPQPRWENEIAWNIREAMVGILGHEPTREETERLFTEGEAEAQRLVDYIVQRGLSSAIENIRSEGVPLDADARAAMSEAEEFLLSGESIFKDPEEE